MALPNTPITSGAAIPFIPAVAGSGGSPTESFLAVAVGTFVANGATPVTVAVAGAQPNLTSIIMFSLNTVGGTVGAVPSVKTITAGVGFTVAGTASDTSTYNYLVLG
jgi:hypothetical protein